MSTFCLTFFDSACKPHAAAGATTSTPTLGKDHQRELDHEQRDPTYAQLKKEAIEAGTAVIEEMSRGTRATFASSMQRAVDELNKIRNERMAAEPVLAPFLRDSNNATTSNAAEIQAALLRVRNAVKSRRLELNKEQTGAESEQQGEDEGNRREQSAADLALAAFRNKLQKVAVHVTEREEEPKTALNLSVPWRLNYFVELRQSFVDSSKSSGNNDDANQQQGVVQFEGGTITDAEGNPLWDVACELCSCQIQRGAFGEGVKRIVRLDSDNQHSCCEPCFELYCKIAEQVPGFTESSGESDGGLFFAPPSSAMDVVETDEQTMMRVAAARYFGSHHIGHCIRRALRVFSGRPALGWRTRFPTQQQEQDSLSKNFTWITYKQLLAASSKVANFLTDLRSSFNNSNGGNGGRLYVALSSSNRFEFTACDIACAFTGAISVGIHTTYTVDELLEVMQHVRPDVVICDAAQLSRFVRVAEQQLQQQQQQHGAGNKLKMILCMDKEVPAAELLAAQNTGVQIRSLYDVAFSPEQMSSQQQQDEEVVIKSPLMDENCKIWFNEQPQEQRAADEGDSNLFSIIFTSGSTGSPKGVMHPEHSFCSDIAHALNVRPIATISFIPLSHSTDRLRVYETLCNGGRVLYSQYDHSNWLDHELAVGAERFRLLEEAAKRGGSDNGVEQLLHDATVLRPTVFIAPPRIWKGLEFIFKQQLQAAATGDDAVKIKQQIIETVWRGKNNKQHPSGGPFARIKSCATGGGPTDASSFAFVRDVAGVPLLESYGGTEFAGTAIGTTGEHRGFMKLMEGVEVRLLDEKTGEDITAVPGRNRGEALIHTPHITPGYFRSAAATQQVLRKDDEAAGGRVFFVSGDIVEAIKDEKNNNKVTAVRVVDRKKNMLTMTLSRVSGGGATVTPTDQTAVCSAEALEAVATLLPGAMHACAVPCSSSVGVPPSYVLIVSIPSDSSTSSRPKPRLWTDEEKQKFLALTQQSPEAQSLSEQQPAEEWLYPVPRAVVFDEGAAWTMNAQKRKHGLLTVSSKVNRTAVALVFKEWIVLNSFRHYKGQPHPFRP